LYVCLAKLVGIDDNLVEKYKKEMKRYTQVLL